MPEILSGFFFQDPKKFEGLGRISTLGSEKLLFQEEHDGSMKGRDRVCRNNSNHLVSSYVNVDKEPIFYKTSRMTWVANELILEGKYHFFLECMRIPPEWHIWVYFLGDESEAEAFQVTVTLFREDEYGRMNAGFSAQRSYTGPVSYSS